MSSDFIFTRHPASVRTTRPGQDSDDARARFALSCAALLGAGRFRFSGNLIAHIVFLGRHAAPRGRGGGLEE